MLKTQLYNNGEIVYQNGRNGTWFDWDVNGHTSPFTVCFNDKKRMGYISVYIFKDGNVNGYKWGNYGKDKAESINLGTLSADEKNLLINLLWQQEWDKNIFDKSIDCIDWEASVFLLDMENTDDFEEENK